MLPGRPSTRELYACGPRVQIPNIKVNNGRKLQNKSSPESAATAPTRASTEGSTLRRRHTVGGPQRTLRTHLRDLRQTLTFSEDVVSSRSPLLVSYSQARGGLAAMFVPATGTNRRRGARLPELSGYVGRHNCRGDPRKHHPCHLHSVPTTEKGAVQKHLQTHQIPSLPSNNIHSNRMSSHPSNMLYRNLRIVPTTKSVQWETEALKKLTSSTAVRLKKGEEHGEELTDAVTEGGVSSSAVGGEVGVESEGRVYRVQDYLSSLEQGARPVHHHTEGRDAITLDNDTRFDKVLQRSYPQAPSQWCGGPQEKEDPSLVRGSRRWTDLPQPAPTPERLRWVRYSEQGPTPSSPSAVPSFTNQESRTKCRYCHILREWSGRHSIHVHPEDTSKSAILQNIHSHTNSAKLRGIAACAYLAEEMTRQDTSCCVEGGEVVTELEKVLDDASTSVPAAIALHCLSRETEKAVDALLKAVGNEECDLTDKWVGLQCLMEGGACDECVVKGLQGYLLNSPDPSCREQAGELMARLSDRTPLVHALLAEQLTSRGFQERLSACYVLATLLCPLSNDVCNRLVVMTWEDWSGMVRDAAAQTLGKTGHGKLLHDELVRRLNEEVEIQRLDALHKLHYLELMTPQLLSAFLPSLSDQHASIRTEAIAICGKLALRDAAVIQQLIGLLGDPIWTIRAHTLRALREIGCYEDDVMEQLLWTVRCDKVPAVRAEACHTLCDIWRRKKREGRSNTEGQEDGGDSRLIATLRERLVVEDDVMVSHQLTSALHRLGGRVDKEDPLLNSIRSEVQRLGTCLSIRQGIVDNDRTALTDYVISRPLVHLTTRDYLISHLRHKFYPNKTTPTTKNPAIKGVEPATERVWSPDRDTIDQHLANIQQATTRHSMS